MYLVSTDLKGAHQWNLGPYFRQSLGIGTYDLCYPEMNPGQNQAVVAGMTAAVVGTLAAVAVVAEATAIDATAMDRT